MQQYPLKDGRQCNQLCYCFAFVADWLLKGKKAISLIGKQRGKCNIFSHFVGKILMIQMTGWYISYYIYSCAYNPYNQLSALWYNSEKSDFC